MFSEIYSWKAVSPQQFRIPFQTRGTHPMNGSKCLRCGFVSSRTKASCKRCGAAGFTPSEAQPQQRTSNRKLPVLVIAIGAGFVSQDRIENYSVRWLASRSADWLTDSRFGAIPVLSPTMKRLGIEVRKSGLVSGVVSEPMTIPSFRRVSS